MSYRDIFLLSESADKTVFRCWCTDTIWRADLTKTGLRYQIFDQDGDDYYVSGMDPWMRGLLSSWSPFHWEDTYWPKDLAKPDYDALDAARTARYMFTIPKTAILGVKGQEHRVVNRSGQAYNLLRILLTVTPEFGQTPAERVVTNDKDLLNDLGRFPTWEEERYAIERVDGYGWFNAKQVIPTTSPTEICIYQEIVLDLNGDSWRRSRDIDNHVFGGYQRLLQLLNEYIGKDIGNGRWYY